MTIQKYRLGFAVLVTAVVSVGVLLAGGREEKQKPQPPTRAADQAKGWERAGRAQAAGVDVRAQVTGQLTRVAVKDGSAVKKGDLLAEIDPRAHRLAVEMAKARMKGAEAKLQAVTIEAANARGLFQQKAISQNDLNRYLAREADAEAAVLLAKAEVDRAELTLSWTRVTAPFDGLASRVQVTEGAFATADQTVLLRVVAIDPMYVSFDVPEAVLLQLRRDGLADPGKLGVAVGFTGEEGYPHEAKLDAIEPEVDPKTGVVRFRAAVPNPKGLLWSGMSARVHLAPLPK